MSTIRLNPHLGEDLARSEEVRHACMEKARKGAEFAKSIAPVLTGAYRDSIHAEETADGAQIVAGTDHGIFVEVGTSDTPAFHVLARTGAALERL